MKLARPVRTVPAKPPLESRIKCEDFVPLTAFLPSFHCMCCMCIFHMLENSGQQLVEAKVERKTCQMISSICNSNNNNNRKNK